MAEPGWEKLKKEWKEKLGDELNPFRSEQNRFGSSYAEHAENLVDRVWFEGDRNALKAEFFDLFYDFVIGLPTIMTYEKLLAKLKEIKKVLDK